MRARISRTQPPVVLGIGFQLARQLVDHGMDHGLAVRIGHLAGGGNLGAVGARRSGGRGHGRRQLAGEIDVLLLGQVFDIGAHLRRPGRIRRGAFQQRDEVVHRALMIAALVAVDGQEIARARIGGVAFQRALEDRGGLVRDLAFGLHHRLALRRQIFDIVGLDRHGPGIGLGRIGGAAGAHVGPGQHLPALGIARILLQLGFQPGDHAGHFAIGMGTLGARRNLRQHFVHFGRGGALEVNSG